MVLSPGGGHGHVPLIGHVDNVVVVAGKGCPSPATGRQDEEAKKKQQDKKRANNLHVWLRMNWRCRFGIVEGEGPMRAHILADSCPTRQCNCMRGFAKRKRPLAGPFVQEGDA